MTRTGIAIVLTSLLLVLGATDAEAASFGRVSIMIKSADGQALKGVTIEASCPSISFTKTLVTKKNGKATLSVPDPTKRYTLLIQHEGFQPQKITVKPEVGQTSSAEIVLVPVRKAEPVTGAMMMTPAHEVFNEGVEAARAGDSVTAKSKFLEALKINPDLAAAHLALASIYLDSGENEAGLAEAQKTIELDNENVLAYRMLYEFHQRLGNQAESDRILGILGRIDQSGDAAAIVFNEGAAAYRVGDTKTAMDRFYKALEIDPNLTPALEGLAGIYARQGDYAKAAEMSERYLALEPQGLAMLRLRWEVYRALGDQEKEDQALQALAAVDTEVLADQILKQASEQFDQGDVVAAKEGFEKVLALDPDHASAHYRYALCLISEDQGAQAKEHLARFLELAPEHSEAGNARDMLGYLE